MPPLGRLPSLGNPLRPVLLAAGRSPRLERAVSRVGVTRRVVERFVPGESEAAVLSAATGLLASGRLVSVDHLGEHTTDAAQAEAAVQAYLSLLGALADVPTPSGVGVPALEISVKLSALGQALAGGGHQVALVNARRICRAADRAGIWVNVDAEDHATTDSTLAIVGSLRVDHPSVATVLQAYLHRTESDCRRLAGPGSRIRLCKGAYAEPASVAYQSPAEVEESYLRCLRILMEDQSYPMVASHDPAIIAAALDLVSSTGRGRDTYEFQMLYGIRDAEQRRLAAEGHHVRVYTPYGDQWYGYFLRRLAERPANLAFFLRSLTSRR